VKGAKWVGALLVAGSAVCFAGPGGWLKSVPAADRARTNPYAGQVDAAAAGKNLFANNCSKCHGANAEGKGRKPALVSDVLRNATDGEVQWLIKNGEPFKGMPGWGSMPEQERWQIVAWLRSVNQQGGNAKSAEPTGSEGVK
jgi:mono/diheme cytochrome c family protein